MMPLGSPGDSLTHPESDVPDTNEAAERLLDAIDDASDGDTRHVPTAIAAIEAHDAAERRATVERIEALDRFSDDSGIEYVEVAAIRAAILDEEAAR